MMKRTIWLVVALILILGMLPLASQAAPLMNLSWRAEYYDNPTLSGQPKIVRFEDNLKHNWEFGSPAPEIPVDHFGARWTVTRHLEKGTYLFLVDVDDGARVWLDGDLIIDEWTLCCKENIQAKVYIETTGNHEIQVAYFEDVGRAMIDFRWIQLGGEDDIVGAWRGEYFHNRDVEGEPVVIRQDGKISFDWNSGSPDARIPRDNFSVRWTRSIYLEAGHYRLRIQHDDGMRIWVDDYNVYDSWRDQSVTYQTRVIYLETGYHAFRVEYYDHLNNAVAVMMIDNDPGDYSGDNGDQPTPGETVIVDNTDAGFQWGGPLSSRFVGYNGCWGHSYYWTYNSVSVPVNSGKWTPDLPGGDYQVFAFIPAANATSRSARYQIHHNGTRHDRVVNQSIYHNTWISLGTYRFSGNGNEYVRLNDSTSEATGSTQIAFDAIKFVKR